MKKNVESIIYIMDSDEIYKFIGYTVAVIFFIYLISKAFSMNVRLIEGLTSNDKPEKKKKERIKHK